MIFFLLVSICGFGLIIHHVFFKRMAFIQSNVYPNLYLVKHPVKDQTIRNKAIRDKVIEHLKNGYAEGKQLADTKGKYIYFYEYYRNFLFSFAQDSGTYYFINNEEELGGFVSEELGMYTEYRLAEFFLDNCENDNSDCGELNYFNDGDFIKAERLTHLPTAPVQTGPQNLE